VAAEVTDLRMIVAAIGSGGKSEGAA